MGDGRGPDPDIVEAAMLLVGGGPVPGPCGNGEGPPGPGVDALEGAGDPGNGTDGGPEVCGPVKLFGGMLKGCVPVEPPLAPEKDGVAGTWP